jgi:predicted RNA-binding Zn-ribbon protein involved in translation (DUF1610 family)
MFNSIIIKEKTLCPKCNREINTSWNYCPICGESIVKKCDNCGTFFQGLTESTLCFKCEKAFTVERAKNEIGR